MNPHRSIGGLSQPLGEPDVVQIAVGDEDSRDISQRVSKPFDPLDEQLPMSGESGIDDGERVSLLDDVPVDPTRAEPIHPIGDFSAANQIHTD